MSLIKAENSPIIGEDLESRKNTLGMVRRYSVPNIQKRGQKTMQQLQGDILIEHSV